MIAKIEGIVWDTNEKFLTVGVGGIGFKIYTTEETKTISHNGTNISLFTHLVVKEDALDLYGFLSKDELEFFEMIISISGIGPKTALNVLNASSIIALKRAISSQDTTQLTKVSGIGKKIAEKMVLELKTVENMTSIHHAQLLTYLKLSGYKTGLLLNFHCTVLKDGIKRMVL